MTPALLATTVLAHQAVLAHQTVLAHQAVLADTDKGKGSPIGLFVVLVLVIAVYFLYRSMNKHLRRIPPSFDPTPPAAGPTDAEELDDKPRD